MLSGESNLFSIIVPAFNSHKYLSGTIESLLTQTYENFEIIIVDDGSTDETFQIAVEFAKKDSRIRVIQHKVNRGESAAINSGWKISKGNFVSIISSDDPQDRIWLEKMLSGIRTYPGYTHYYPDRMIIAEDGKVISKENMYEWKLEILVGKMICIASAGTIINKKLLPPDFLPRDEALKQCSDLSQMLALSKFGQGKRIPFVYGVWRKHPGNLSRARSLVDKISEFETFSSSWLHNNLLYVEKAELLLQARVYIFLQKLHWSFEQLGTVKGFFNIFVHNRLYFPPLFEPPLTNSKFRVVCALCKVIWLHHWSRFIKIPKSFIGKF